jgi:hypothetical protein
MFLSVNENTVGEIEFCNRGSTSGAIATGDIGLNDGNWHHVVDVQRSKTDRELYVDNISRGTDTTSIGTSSLNRTTIGARRTATTGNYFNGIIDDVRVYNRALGIDEIEALYNSGGGCQ